MCKFCNLDEFGYGDEITRKFMAKPIDVGDFEDVFQLEAWMMSDEPGKDVKLQLCLTVTGTGDDLATLDIPINYCPMCGRKLK